MAKNPETDDTMETTKQNQSEEEVEHSDEQKQEDELRSLLLSDIGDLPLSPPSATQVNFVSYFITGSSLTFIQLALPLLIE